MNYVVIVCMVMVLGCGGTNLNPDTVSAQQSAEETLNRYYRAMAEADTATYLAIDPNPRGRIIFEGYEEVKFTIESKEYLEEGFDEESHPLAKVGDIVFVAAEYFPGYEDKPIKQYYLFRLVENRWVIVEQLMINDENYPSAEDII